MEFKIKKLESSDLEKISNDFSGTYLEGREKTFKKYLDEQNKNERVVILAVSPKEKVIGYVTLHFKSNYNKFREKNIPEIVDLNVAPNYREKGIATKLLDYLESLAEELGYQNVGLGVGLYEDYGSAQRLYVKRGYIPDGAGVTINNKPVKGGDLIVVDDNPVISLVKKL